MLRIFIISAALVFGIAACKSKKTAVTATGIDNSEAELAAAQTKYPDATMLTIKRGNALYFGTCTNCHGAKDINRFSVESWPGIVDRMAKKARISEEDKKAVLHYVMGVKLSAVNR